MTIVRALSLGAVAVMVVSLAVGFSSGDFGSEGSAILDLVWGRITLIDLYVGIALFAGYVAWRERSPVVFAGWLVVLVVLGNLGTALYLAVASFRASTIDDLLRPVR